MGRVSSTTWDSAVVMGMVTPTHATHDGEAELTMLVIPTDDIDHL